MAIEIVDFPTYKMVIFHSYVKLPEGNADCIYIIYPWSAITQETVKFCMMFLP